MKLNPDCVRDVLMALEGITDGRTSYTFGSRPAGWAITS